MKVYNKLVRDKIPEIIEADGKVCRTHILSNEEYIVALEAKLNEEVAEYQADKNLEEMADVQICLDTLKEYMEISDSVIAAAVEVKLERYVKKRNDTNENA